MAGARARAAARIIGGAGFTLLLTFIGLSAVTFVIGRVMPADPVLAMVGDRAPQNVYDLVYRRIIEPEVVLLDEPTSALDVSVQAEVLNLLTRLKREHGLTYVLVSHDFAVVSHTCDRLSVMQHGAVLETLSVQQLRANEPRHPYTRQLLMASRGYDRSAVDSLEDDLQTENLTDSRLRRRAGATRCHAQGRTLRRHRNPDPRRDLLPARHPGKTQVGHPSRANAASAAIRSSSF